MQTLDRSRPLWEMWFVGGLADGSVGLVYKVHHAVVDGVSAAETFELLLDPRPLSSAGDPKLRRAHEVGAAVRRSCGTGSPTTCAPWRGRRPVGSGCSETGSGPRCRARAHPPAPPHGHRAPIVPEPAGRDRRRLAIVDLDLDEVKRIGRAQGATVNDVVLALVSSGLGALFADRGESSPNVQVLVPVSLRPPTDRGSLGNQVTALVVRLPVADRASAALAQVVAETSRLKSGPDGAGLDLLLRWTDTWPLPLLRWAAGLVHHQPFVNLVVTNVRGPAEPLALLGAELTQIVPIVPSGGNLTVGVAVLSYRGRLVIGVHADADACPTSTCWSAASTTRSPSWRRRHRSDLGGWPAGLPRDRSGLGRFVEQAEVALLLLGEVEPEDGVEAVQQPAQLEHVALVRLVGLECIQHTSEPADEPSDLGVRSAHRDGRLPSAECPVEERVELRTLSGLVGRELVDEEAVDGAHVGDGLRRRRPAEQVGGRLQPIEAGPQRPVLGDEAPGDGGVRRRDPSGGLASAGALGGRSG